MAILFFEGLPRAGKSYEAMVKQIIPWLQKGKHVVAYIEGLNFERIAEAAKLDVDTVRELLHPLVREDMQTREAKTSDGKTIKVDGPWIDKVRDNALHVFDEAQNWWPNKARATDELTQFVSEHGHRGMTILLMGQSLKDVHALWRRRVDQKLVFLKLSALGTAKRYQVTVYKGQGDEVFAHVTNIITKYDPSYFGTYASHVSEDTDTETYTDPRVNVFSSSLFRWTIPVMLGLGIWGGVKAYRYFQPETVAKAPAPGSNSVANAAAAVALPAKPATQAAPAETPPVPAKTPEERYFVDLTEKGRARLAGFIQGNAKRYMVVEWIDGGTRVIERMTLDQLEVLGVAVNLRGSTVKLALGDWSQIVTMWPLEVDGKVSEYGYDEKRARERASAGAAVHEATGRGLIHIGESKAATAAPSPPEAAPQPQRIASVKR